jgi:glycosyltransferase involved in cell wall biosynthesis
MTKIFFAGELRSPFIEDDVKLLKEDNEVAVFDIGKYLSLIRIPIYFIKCLQQIPKILSSDIVWVWFADYPEFPIVLLSKILNKPIVVNIGGFEVSGIKEINYGNQLKFVRGWVSRWILRNATELIVPSPAYNIQTLKVGIGIKLMDNTFALPEDDYYFENYYLTHTMAHITTIPNWVDTKTCDIPLPKKENLVVTAVCSKFAYDYKGIPIFKRASGIIPYKSKILEHLPRKEYESELQHAKVYCQLSRDETFGISLVEAMAYGCVPVVSDKGALPWIVGNAGVVIPYGNAWAATAGILKAMDMDGQAARDRARFFSREKKQEAVRQLIKELI